MGIYDRDYYRKEGRSFLGSLAERGTVCKWLIGINVACFFLQFITTSGGVSSFTNAFILNVPAVLHGEVWRVLTYAFLHTTSSIWHILVNMLFLYIFGRDLEEAYGGREFLTLYLLSALVGGLVFVLVPMGGIYCLGASGAVTTIMVLAACREPRRIILLFMVFPCPIWLLVAFMVAKDAFEFLGGSRSGTAVQVHLAGAAFGFLYYHFQWRLTGWWPEFRRRARRVSRPKLRVYEEPDDDREPAGVAAPTPVAPASQAALDDEQLDAKVDAILEKISRVGKDNITDGERAVLLRASERIRRRRR